MSNPNTCSKSTDTKCGNLEISVGNYGNAPFYYDAYIQGTIGDLKFTSGDNLKGLNQSTVTSPQNFLYVIPVWWNFEESVDIEIKIMCDYVYIPIKWAVTGVESRGILRYNIPPSSTACGVFGNGATEEPIIITHHSTQHPLTDITHQETTMSSDSDSTTRSDTTWNTGSSSSNQLYVNNFVILFVVYWCL